MKCRTVIACVGSWLRRDDALGLEVYQALKTKTRCLAYCEYGLENCVHEIKEFKPEVLVVVDAIYSPSLRPGDLVLAPISFIEENYMAHTHRLNLNLVLDYLHRELGYEPKVIVLGLVAQDVSIGLGLTPTVRRRLNVVVETALSILSSCSQSRVKSW